MSTWRQNFVAFFMLVSFSSALARPNINDGQGSQRWPNNLNVFPSKIGTIPTLAALTEKTDGDKSTSPGDKHDTDFENGVAGDSDEDTDSESAGEPGQDSTSELGWKPTGGGSEAIDPSSSIEAEGSGDGERQSDGSEKRTDSGSNVLRDGDIVDRSLPVPVPSPRQSTTLASMLSSLLSRANLADKTGGASTKNLFEELKKIAKEHGHSVSSTDTMQKAATESVTPENGEDNGESGLGAASLNKDEEETTKNAVKIVAESQMDLNTADFDEDRRNVIKEKTPSLVDDLFDTEGFGGPLQTNEDKQTAIAEGVSNVNNDAEGQSETQEGDQSDKNKKSFLQNPATFSTEIDGDALNEDSGDTVSSFDGGQDHVQLSLQSRNSAPLIDGSGEEDEGQEDPFNESEEESNQSDKNETGDEQEEDEQNTSPLSKEDEQNTSPLSVPGAFSLDQMLLNIIDEQFQRLNSSHKSAFSGLLAGREVVEYQFGTHNVTVPITNIQVTGGEGIRLQNKSSNLDDLSLNLTFQFNISVKGKFDASGSLSGLNRHLARALRIKYPKYGNGTINAAINNAIVRCRLELQHSANDRRLAIESMQMEERFSEPDVQITSSRLPRTLHKLRFRQNFERIVAELIRTRVASQIEPLMRGVVWEAVTKSLARIPLDGDRLQMVFKQYIEPSGVVRLF